MELELTETLNFIQLNLHQMREGLVIPTADLRKCQCLITVFNSDTETNPTTASKDIYKYLHNRYIDASVQKIVKMFVDDRCIRLDNRGAIVPQQKECAEFVIRSIHHVLDVIRTTGGIYGVRRIIAILLGMTGQKWTFKFRKHRLFGIGRYTSREMWNTIICELMQTKVLVMNSPSMVPRLSPEAKLWFKEYRDLKNSSVTINKFATNYSVTQNYNKMDNIPIKNVDKSIADDGKKGVQLNFLPESEEHRREQLLERLKSTIDYLSKKYLDAGLNENNMNTVKNENCNVYDDEPAKLKPTSSNKRSRVCFVGSKERDEKRNNADFERYLNQFEKNDILRAMMKMLDKVASKSSVHVATSELCKYADICKQKRDAAKMDSTVTMANYFSQIFNLICLEFIFAVLGKRSAKKVH